MTEWTFWLAVLGWLLRVAAVVLPVIGLIRIYRRATRTKKVADAGSEPWNDNSPNVPTVWDIALHEMQFGPIQRFRDAKRDLFLIGFGLLAGLLAEILFAVS